MSNLIPLRAQEVTRKTLIFILAVLFISSYVLAAQSGLQATVQVLGGVIPFVQINSPVEGHVYNDDAIVVDISTIEEVKNLRYSLNGGRYKRLCRNCQDFYGTKTFPEGYNTFSVRAEAQNGTYYYDEVFFRVLLPDTTPPKIYRVLPTRTGNGLFAVKYTETNISQVMLYYGIDFENSVELFGCPLGKKQVCSKFVNISSYDGQRIYYLFVIKDGSYTTFSKKTRILVDSTAPAVLAAPATIQATEEANEGKSDKRILRKVLKALKDMFKSVRKSLGAG